MTRLSEEMVDRMVKDATFVFGHGGNVPAACVKDLCCHIMALAADRADSVGFGNTLYLREPAPCAAQLWNEGKASPRTCQRCGLGPCPLGESKK